MSDDLHPIDDPIELRDAIAEDRRNAAKRAGNEIPWELAQQIATADLSLVDRARFSGDLKPCKTTLVKPPAPIPNDNELEARLVPDVDQVIKRAAFAKRPDDGELPEVVKDILVARLVGMSLPKFRAMKERLAIITGHSHVYDPANPMAHLEYRRWGALVVMETCDFVTRHPRTDYHGKSFADAHRVFWRRLEDICDKSNGDPGLPNWWIK